jgi:SpoVK/Ycf46/Vps4 family AAA+-type ATPase
MGRKRKCCNKNSRHDDEDIDEGGSSDTSFSDTSGDDSDDDSEDDFIYEPPKRHKSKLCKPIKVKLTMCYNKSCDHKQYKNAEKWETEHPMDIKQVDTLKDLIRLADMHHCKMRKSFNGVDLSALVKVKDSLIELDNMIGLANIKNQIVGNIKTFLLQKETSNNHMLHSVITGNAGCGKTTFIEILAKIYKDIGILKKGHVVKANRANLIGKYCGHTAIKTKEKIEEAWGGILLIDEAYQLGNGQDADCFAKECVDTLNQHLSETISDEEEVTDIYTGETVTKEDRFFICFIAGYKDALEKDFFSQNQGLMRRFPFRYDIEEYNADELAQIFLKKIRDGNLLEVKFEQKDLKEIIAKNSKYMKNQGGDMQTLYLKTVIAQIDRTFLLSIEDKKILLLEDVKKAVDLMVMHAKKTIWEPPFGLYT